MKKILMVLLLGVVALHAGSKVQLSVGGMSCQSCVSGINNVFKDDFPAYNVSLDFESTVLTVISKDGSDVDVKIIQSTLEEIGYKGRVLKGQ